MKYADVLKDIITTWNGLYHNARVYLPYDMLTDDARGQGHFEQWLADYAQFFREDLQQEIKKDFGIGLVITGVGRSGSTIIPVTWNLRQDDRFHEACLDCMGVEEQQSSIEDYNYARKVLKVLELVNERVREANQAIPAEYKDFLKHNPMEVK